VRLGALKGVEVAQVWKADRPAARLTRTWNSILFEYEEEYDGEAVATTLPRDGKILELRGGALPPFFTGLLPEGRRLTAIQRAAKTSADDELTLLLAVGSDAIGDVRVLPHGQDPTETPPSLARPLAEISFAELYSQVLSRDPLDRVAIPGAQDKVSGGMISLPLAYEGASYLLKLDPPEYRHLVANEAFFMEAARESGLQVADSEIVQDREGQLGLLVRRFDRVPTDKATDEEPTGLQSLPQEDACQVLGLYPASKYRLTTEELILGLSQVTGAPVVAARRLLQQFAFAYLTCNGDAHGKNFSVYEREGEWHVTPAYDLPSTHPYGDTTMALTIGGKDREDIGRQDFLTCGQHCGVSQKATIRLLDTLLSHMPAWLDRLEDLPYDSRQIHKLRQACRYRAQSLSA